MPLPFAVYVLQSEADGGLYIGFTTDIGRRLAEHNAGKNISTAKRRPLRLVFCECYASESDARRREKYFKSTKGRRALKLILSETLGPRDEAPDMSAPAPEW